MLELSKNSRKYSEKRAILSILNTISPASMLMSPSMSMRNLTFSNFAISSNVPEYNMNISMRMKRLLRVCCRGIFKNTFSSCYFNNTCYTTSWYFTGIIIVSCSREASYMSWKDQYHLLLYYFKK